jgi:hypothetical protein
MNNKIEKMIERKKKEERRKKDKKRRKPKKEKNKNAPRFFFSFIKISESFENKFILNLFQTCAIR